MKTEMTNVWELETTDEKWAAIELADIAEAAIDGNRKLQNYLKKLWNENWPSIKKKLMVEGSAWYVWWMDGVRQHIINNQKTA